MIITRPLDQFHRLQATVLSLLDRARPHFNGRDPQAWNAIAPFRTELAAALQALQIHKHREIFDPIIAAGGPDVANVKALKVDCIKLGLDYQAYTQKWATVDIDAHWPEYRLAALSMMRQIRERMAAQDAAIRALYATPGPHVGSNA